MGPDCVDGREPEDLLSRGSHCFPERSESFVRIRNDEDAELIPPEAADVLSRERELKIVLHLCSPYLEPLVSEIDFEKGRD